MNKVYSLHTGRPSSARKAFRMEFTRPETLKMEIEFTVYTNHITFQIYSLHGPDSQDVTVSWEAVYTPISLHSNTSFKSLHRAVCKARRDRAHSKFTSRQEFTVS